MYKGITLLETLIVLFILSVTLAFALPNGRKMIPNIFLEKEQQRLLFFSYVIFKRGQKTHRRFGLFWPIKIGQINVGVSQLK